MSARVRAKSQRRARPSRPALDRDTVLRAGVELVNREGVDAATFRRIADSLSVTPMALYRHVKDESHLLAGMSELIVPDAAVAEHDEPDWRDWTCESFRRMADAMLEQRGVLSLVARAGAFGPSTAIVVEETLSRLCETGFSPREASDLILDLNRCMLGVVLFDGAYWPAPDTPDRERKMRAGFEMLSEDHFPSLTEHAAEVATAFSGRNL